jgi:hypothetical protein
MRSTSRCQIIHFEIGQLDFLIVEHIARTGVSAIDGDQTRYTPSTGCYRYGMLLRVIPANGAAWNSGTKW